MRSAQKRIYFDDVLGCQRVKCWPNAGTMGSDIIAAVCGSPLYDRIRQDGICFRVATILTYWVGAMFANGGNGPMWAEAVFEFQNITDEEQVMLIMRDGFNFAPDLAQYRDGFSTGVEWENKHRLLANFRR